MINATHDDTASQHPNERHDAAEARTPVSRRPAWAEETQIDPEAIVHYWRSPILARGADTEDGETYPIPVEIVVDDGLFVTPDGVFLERGAPRIFLSDTYIRDTENGRLLAAAIIECCDRIDAAQAGQK